MVSEGFFFLTIETKLHKLINVFNHFWKKGHILAYTEEHIITKMIIFSVKFKCCQN